MRVEGGIAAIKGRAIGANDLLVVAHVEKDVGMVERGRCANAHEFLGADLDRGNARIVVKMWYKMVGHVFALEIVPREGKGGAEGYVPSLATVRMLARDAK